MSSFTGRLQLDFGDFTDLPKSGGRYAFTLGAVQWVCDAPDFEVECVIPTGSYSDGASVPRFLWWFLPPWGDRATFAALLHDHLLDRLQGFVPGGPVPGAETRERCDRQFLIALRALEVARWRAWPAWAGVRAHSLILAATGGADRPIAAA